MNIERMKFVMKTGLEIWAETHNTTADEIKILLLAEGRELKQFLGDSLTSEVPLSGGRDGALTLLLNRGRAGEIDVCADMISSVTGKQIEAAFVKSSELPVLLDINTAKQAESETVEPPVTAKQQKKSDDNKETKPARKKNKYSISKAVAEEILRAKSGSPSIKAIRMFFLSLPDYKAQDIAIMPDEEIQAEFNDNYVCIPGDNGTLIVSRPVYNVIRDTLIENDSYYVPNE